ncbi:MAG: FMN-binding protein [Burkholderiales bacterium]|nr:FMN-binding protein [Burkholderiales bacterium]
MRFEPLALAAAVLAPSTAWAVDYLSADQAAQLIFPDADRFEAATVELDAAAMRRLQDAGVRARSARWPVQAAKRGDAVLGYLVVDNVVGKFELIGYAVGLAHDLTIKQVEVLSYRESHGHEIRSPAWRRQFVGKGPASALRIGDDIANISGATLSCEHVTEGVRRVVAVLAQARGEGALP